MNPNFDKLRLRYKHPLQGVETTNFVMELSSINFDVNQSTVEPDTPFTTEMSFELRVTDRDVDGNPIDIVLDPANPLGNLNKASSFTNFLQNDVFLSNAKRLSIEFWDMAKGEALPVPCNCDLRHSVVTLQSVNSDDTRTAFWLVQLKFLGFVSGVVSTITNPVPALLYPVLRLPIDGELFTGNLQAQFSNFVTNPDPLLNSFNAELQSAFELAFVNAGTGSTGTVNSIGKVADEISDSFANLGNVLATQLSSTINARLQPVAGPVTNDLALWAIIQMATKALSFDNYMNYMNAIFCGIPNNGLTGNQIQGAVNTLRNNRSTPFMGADAYNSIKIATEAFVMVNCMANQNFTDEELKELGSNVPLIDGVFDQQSLQTWWNNYRVRQFDLEGNAVDTIPYLAVIRNKLGFADFKTTSFAQAFQIYANTGITQVESNCYGIILEKLQSPCFLELIWSYWHEECMMVQGFNAIGRRFQNIKGPGAVDPLANLEIDPLRPLSNLLWGYFQDEQHRLTVRRRSYEYDHHYGISLQGGAVQNMRFADSRSRFIEAFHTLLNTASKYYRQSDDMTVQPDAFPLLNALKETHLVISEGAHNQYGDLPSVARAEMLMQQWLLSRDEFREFLPNRIMVPYQEPWMGRVASLNNMMGWTKTNVMHFHDLGVFGEQLLLSIRFSNWAGVISSASAGNWARFWRPQIQNYIHAYRAATGVDLTTDVPGNKVDATLPSLLLQRKLQEQRGNLVA